jgi:putative endonuclease
MAYNRLIGNVGEDIACEWLKKRGFLILDRNYNKKWGELDIVVIKDKILQFIEVKSLTDTNSGYRAEENVHDLKVKRLKRTIQTYMLEKKYGLEKPFLFHIMVVNMNKLTRRAKVQFMENIIL